MDATQLLILIFAIFAAAAGIILYMRSQTKTDGQQSQAITMLQNQLAQLAAQLNEKQDRTLKEVNDRLRETNTTLTDQLIKNQASSQLQFSSSQKIIQQVTEKLTKLDETNKQVVGFADQLQSLEKILRNPKQRGVLGEYYLETVLKNVLPPDAFKLQYRFPNNEIVDALIVTKDGLIPVDAKFSLENYNRMTEAETPEERDRVEKLFKQDLKNRIDETSKYIRPQDGTLDFAFMFIPADGLYYDLLVQKVGGLDVNSVGLIEYAFRKKVMLVSPTTFFAYLQTVLQGLRALKIEESAMSIRKHVEELQRHLNSYQEHFGRVGKYLGTTVSAYNTANKELGKIDKDMFRITGGERLTIETIEVSPPSPDDIE